MSIFSSKIECIINIYEDNELHLNIETFITVRKSFTAIH